MKLNKLEIKCFRGIKDLTLEFGDINAISGKNGIGKTTVLDSIMWLLCDETLVYGKQNDDNKNKLNHLDKVDVTGYFVKNNGDELVLQRCYYENWKDDMFDKVVNKFFINQATYKVTEYFERIRNEIGIEHNSKVKLFNMLRSLVDYNYFNELDYKIVKEYLNEISKNPSDDEMLKLGGFEIIGNDLKNQKYDVGKTKTVFTTAKKKAEEEIIKYNTEIESAKKKIDAEKVKKYEEYNQEKDRLYKESFANTEISKKLLKDIEENQKAIDLEYQNKNDELANANKKVIEISDKSRVLGAEINNINYGIQKQSDWIETKKNEYSKATETENNAKEQLERISQEKFVEIKCPNCQFVLNKQEENTFNDNIKTRIENGNKYIDNVQAFKEKMKTDILEIEKHLEESKKIYNAKIDDFNALKKEYELSKAELEKLQNAQDLSHLNELKYTSAKLHNSYEEERNKFTDEIKDKLLEIQSKITECQNIVETQRRLEDLEIALKEIKNAKAKAETQLVALAQFKDFKTRLIKENAQKLFPDVEFEMIHVSETTGNLEDCCHAVLKGVEFNGVNNGNRYILGVKIIESLKKALHVTEDLPIIFDRKADLDKANFEDLVKSTSAQIFTTFVNNEEKITINKENR